MIDGVKEYVAQRIFPDATSRNWSSYGEKVKFEKGVNVMEAFSILPDPQTNGGILFSIKETAIDEVVNLLKNSGLENFSAPIGKIVSGQEKIVEVKI